MGNYLTIVSRSEFNDLYKFGHLYVHNMIPFEGELMDHIDDKPLFDAVTAYMNTYEYSTEYLLLHISRNTFAGTSVELFIKDVLDVYALDAEAQANLSVSLDQRINLQTSCWGKYFKELNKKQSIRQSKAGKYNCYEIFGISDVDRSKVESFIPKDFLNELFSDLFDNKRPSGNKTIWTYLLRYERHGAFRKDNRGYFSDAVNVFENYLNQKEMDFEWDDELKFADVIENSGEKFSDICLNLTSNVTNDYIIEGCNYFVVAPLFLYMKSYFERGIAPVQFSQNELFSKGKLYQIYGFDFALAVALLGIKFGHDLTYSCYYEIKNLGIFNRVSVSKLKKITDPSTGKVLTNGEAQNLIETLSYKTELLKEEISNLKVTIERINKPNDQKAESEIESTPQESTGPKLEEDVSKPDEPVSEERDVSMQDDIAMQKFETEDVPASDETTLKVKDTEVAGESVFPTPATTPAESISDNPKSSDENKDELGTILQSKLNQEEKPELIFEPVLMKKLTKNRKKFNNKITPKYAHDKKEYDDFIKDNWAPESYFDMSLSF